MTKSVVAVYGHVLLTCESFPVKLWCDLLELTSLLFDLKVL